MASNPIDVIPGKLFIGGLSMNTTQENLRKYFESFGEVADCVLMMDRTTSKSRGFGFVTMKNPGDVQAILAEKSHILDGKTIDCKEAIPKSSDPGDPSKSMVDVKTKKIFVGGLPHALTEEQITEYFGKYGKVVECQIMKDRENGKPRGFGFVTFDNEEAVEKVLANLKEHKLMDKWVECKKATPKAAPPKPAVPAGKRVSEIFLKANQRTSSILCPWRKLPKTSSSTPLITYIPTETRHGCIITTIRDHSILTTTWVDLKETWVCITERAMTLQCEE